MAQKIVANLSRDMRKEGWTLLEHSPRRINSIADPELVPVLKAGEGRIDGEEMVRRARVELNANLGQEDAEWLLQHQNEIPKEWRNYYISFPRTVWQGEDGSRDVAYLYWDGERWDLHFSWLGGGWDSSGRLLSSGK